MGSCIEGDSVIKKYKSGRIRLTGKDMTLLRLERLQMDRGRCVYCHSLVSDSLPDWHPLKFDLMHIQSRGAGGPDTLENTRTGCHECHEKSHKGKLPSLREMFTN